MTGRPVLVAGAAGALGLQICEPIAARGERLREAPGPRERSLAGVMPGFARGGVADMRELCASSGSRLSPVPEFAVSQLAAAT